MITKTDTLLSKSLIDKRLVDPDALQAVVDEASKSKDTLFALLLRKGLVPEDDLLRQAGELLKLPVAVAGELKSEPGVTDKVPLKIAEYYKIAPLKIEKRKLTVAVAAPLDLRAQDDLRAHLGYEVDVVLARERDIAECVKHAYGFAAGTIGEMVAAGPPAGKPGASSEKLESLENIEKLAGDASIAKLVNQIILEAYRKRATDIHIEPYRGKVKLRYRIDGILYNANVPAEMSRFILPVLSRIKIMSNLNIVERRLPQDGRAIVKVEDTTLDLRVSSIPTPYGESVVIRMLPMNRIFSLSQLGLSPEQLRTFESLIEKPHGIIFITGPTGSGKSTTLYACLNKINTDERKIITIEDPVEYEMEGVTQIQVVGNIGLDFARGLRSMLRHDPDVMMVGEVRDLETAEIAIRVALTGHLVFSTLHTNDAASGITRLVDIGLEPYLIASSVESFIAQRLVRVICPKCKEEDRSVAPEVKRQIAQEMGLRGDAFPVYHGRGCGDCNRTGFWGRVAIYEILVTNERIKELIVKRATAGEIKREAVFSGMRTLRQDGWQKVLAGITTPAEIFEAAPSDREQGDTALETLDALSEATSGLSPRPVIGGKPHKEHGRVFMRLNHTVDIRYKVVKASGQREGQAAPAGEEEKSFTTNISAGGLVFMAGTRMGNGTILELHIELPQAGALDCLARVVRQEETEKGRAYETAVCFLDLSGADRTRLEKFVEKESR